MVEGKPRWDLKIEDLRIDEKTRKETDKGDMIKLALSVSEIRVTVEGPAKGLEHFEQGKLVDVYLGSPQQELG